MKRAIKWSFVVMGLFLYACSGGNSNSSNNASSASSTPGEASSIDVTKSSDSKGVGTFKSVDLPEAVNTEKAAKGKEIFQNKCMACHQAGTQAMIGPGLKGITKIRTPEWILNMITDPDKMLKEDPVAKALLKKFNGTRMTNQGVSKEEAKEILAYLRQNDA